MIGLYLDAVPGDAARDRIITAQEWTVRTLADSNGRCLLGHAWDAVPNGGYAEVRDRTAEAWTMDWINGRNAGFCDSRLGYRFDRLVDRFGMDRVVRAIKQRAARPNRMDSATAFPNSPSRKASFGPVNSPVTAPAVV